MLLSAEVSADMNPGENCRSDLILFFGNVVGIRWFNGDL